MIAKAEGLAIISVIKAGFMITARGGSGIVIARLGDRRKAQRFWFCFSNFLSVAICKYYFKTDFFQINRYVGSGALELEVGSTGLLAEWRRF